MNTVTFISHSIERPEYHELKRLQGDDLCPRITLYEDVLKSEMLTGLPLTRLSRLERGLVRLLPPSIGRVIAIYLHRHEYDIVISWDDRVSLPLGLLMRAASRRPRHIGILLWISPFKKRVLLKHGHHGIDRIIISSAPQRDFAVRALGVPEDKIHFVPHFVDQEFWRPTSASTGEAICAVGNEMRDYPTLLSAMKGLNIRCHIAARSIARPSRKLATEQTIRAFNWMPENVTVGAKSPVELRELYASSRYVVVPLKPSDSDNGITTILEAMAMGKAVICSKNAGLAGVVEHGKTGLFVPPEDPPALRQAIEYLWYSPELASKMGLEGRRRALERHTLDRFVADVRRIAYNN